MKKFKSLIAFLIVSFVGVSAFARDPYKYLLVNRVEDDNVHLTLKPLAGTDVNGQEYTLTENTQYFDQNDEPCRKPDFRKLAKDRIELLVHYNENREISELYVMKAGYNSHEYYIGKGIDTFILEGTVKMVWDNQLRMVPYGSKSVIEYSVAGAKLYNENNIELPNQWKLLSGSSKIRVVLQEGAAGSDIVLAVFMLPLQYDFKTKTIAGTGKGKSSSVDDDGWGSDDDEEEWDGWSETDTKKFDYTVTEGYGYIKDVEYEYIKIARKDGKYKNFATGSGGSQCVIYKEDGKKTSLGAMKWKSGQYCRYLVKKYDDGSEEGIVEVRILPEGTKFDQDRYVPDKLEVVEVSGIWQDKKDKTMFDVKLSFNNQHINCKIDENTRYYDECERQTTYKDVVVPYKVSYYEKDGIKYLYDVYASETWSSIVR